MNLPREAFSALQTESVGGINIQSHSCPYFSFCCTSDNGNLKRIGWLTFSFFIKLKLHEGKEQILFNAAK